MAVLEAVENQVCHRIGPVLRACRYRLQDVAKYRCAAWCKAAIRWIRSVAEEHRIDVDKIGICGGSAGAHLSAMVATTNGVRDLEGTGAHLDQTSDVHLAILFNGHFDMSDQLKDPTFKIGPCVSFFGGHPWEILMSMGQHHLSCVYVRHRPHALVTW